MPTYDYRCLDCGHEFEEFQKMTDEHLKVCPKCKGKLERLIGLGAGFILKGSGFYATDYRSEDYKKKAKAESSGGEKKEGGDKAKGDKNSPDSGKKTESKKEPADSSKKPDTK